MTNSNSLQKCNVFELSLHNGVKCIQSTRPEDQGTVRQIWFTSKLLCEIFDVSRKTLEDNIQSLSDDGEFSMADFRHTEKIPASDGKSYQTTIFNLEVLNKLGMCCFRGNKKAKEIRNKFNDVLVKEETGKEETTQNTLPAVSEEDHFFLKILHAQGTENTALALKDYKLYRDELQREVEQERDEAVRKRKAINDKRTATLMVAKREDNKKINQLTCENTELKEQNEELQKEKDRMFRSFGCTPEKHDWLTVSVMREIWQRNFKKDPQWQDLKRIIKEHDLVEPIKDVIEIVDNKEKFVNRYPRRAWEIYFDEELARKNQTQE